MNALLKTSLLSKVQPAGLLKVLLMLVGIVACASASAQGWEIYFGGNGEDFGHSIIQAQDRGYVGVGYSDSGNPGNNLNIYVIRTDIDGTEVWSNFYDDGFAQHGYSITETPDNGFLVVGDIRPTQSSDANVYLLKINAGGTKLWAKQFGGAGDELGYRIIPTQASSGYLIVGNTTSLGNGGNDAYLIKVDELGEQVWAKAYGTTGDDFGYSVVEVADGYLLAGSGVNPANGNEEAYLLKVDFSGDEQWSKYYSPTSQPVDIAYDLVLAADGNPVLAGSNGSQSEGWLLKTDLAGNQIWSKSIGGALGDQIFDLLKADNGDLVTVGVTEIDMLNSDAFLARFDNDGNQIWAKNVGRGTHLDWGQGVAPAEDGGFIVIGYNAFFVALGNDVTLIKTGPTGDVYTNHLTGQVFLDDDDCILESGEQGLNDWIVRAASSDHTFFGTTDANGHYDITLDTGSYQVSVYPKNDYWSACIAQYNVSFTEQYDTLSRNFPMLPVVDCPLLDVDVSAPVAQNCTNISYTVSYCNAGTVTSPNTTVEVILDNGLTFVSASIPVASQNDSLVTFDLGSVGLDVCGSFYLIAASDCNGQPLEAYVVSAHILPDSICLPTSPNWDMADIAVDGYCDVDSVRFIITNEGTGDMEQPKGFIVIEDNIMLTADPEPFQLLAGQDTIITVPANGSTYRIIAEQTPDHPGNSYPTVAVEGCTTTGTYSTGFLTELQEDENDPFQAVDAQENIPSFSDYILLRGYPKGYQQNGDNLIPANTDIEYHIYFKNVGTDTIDRLVIRDTLSPNLEIGTVVAGASSHPYDFEVYSGGVLKFTLGGEGALLVPGAAGFVKFRVAQQPNLDSGTLIQNTATVFLGYDAPAQTATYTHVVGGPTLLDFIVQEITDVTPSLPIGVKVAAYPNPFVSAIEFEAKGLQSQKLEINVFDIAGKLVRQEKALGNRLRLHRNGMPSGIYTYQLSADGLLLQSGKIMVR